MADQCGSGCDVSMVCQFVVLLLHWQGAGMYCAWVEEMAPKFAVSAVTLYERKFMVADHERMEEKEAKEAAAAAAALLEEGEEEGEKGEEGEKEEEEEEERALPIVRAAVAVAELLKKAPTKALKPIVFILKAMTQPR